MKGLRKLIGFIQNQIQVTKVKVSYLSKIKSKFKVKLQDKKPLKPQYNINL